MSDWIYIDEIKITDKVNTIHCDTRDFHCAVRETKIDLRDRRHPEITRSKHNKAYLIHQDKIKEFLKNIETITGGKGRWRMITFKHIDSWWVKYIRMYRMDNEHFIVCESDNIPVMWELMTEENIKHPHLLNKW